MRALRALIVFLALAPGLFMTFDGSRALIVGDYLTPTSGPHAGQLGPWSQVVGAAGVDPRSTFMKVLFIAFGLAWLVALGAFLRHVRRSKAMLATLAVLTLWYLPIGTATSIGMLIALTMLYRKYERV